MLEFLSNMEVSLGYSLLINWLIVPVLSIIASLHFVGNKSLFAFCYCYTSSMMCILAGFIAGIINSLPFTFIFIISAAVNAFIQYRYWRKHKQFVATPKENFSKEGN